MAYKEDAPTHRMKKTFNDVVINNKPVKRAMEDNGYKPSYAKNPHLLTNSKQWLELLDKHGVSDDDLARTHSKLLRSKNENISVKALDIGYKVKGKYESGSGTTFNAPVQINITPLPPDAQNTA